MTLVGPGAALDQVRAAEADLRAAGRITGMLDVCRGRRPSRSATPSSSPSRRRPARPDRPAASRIVAVLTSQDGNDRHAQPAAERPCWHRVSRMSRRGLPVAIAGGAVVMAALVVAALGQPVALAVAPARTCRRSRPCPPCPRSSPTATTPPADGDRDSDPLRPLAGARRPRPGRPRPGGARGRPRPRPAHPVAPATTAAPRAPRGARLRHPARADELLEAARERLRDLETGEPRNAIVAAWLDLETSAAATGLPRLPAETSTEYTARVIGVWPVDSERLGDLAALYREARFSVHELGEAHRERAIADLRVLIADLERVATAAGGRAGRGARARTASRPSRTASRATREGAGRDGSSAGRRHLHGRAPSLTGAAPVAAAPRRPAPHVGRHLGADGRARPRPGRARAPRDPRRHRAAALAPRRPHRAAAPDGRGRSSTATSAATRAATTSASPTSRRGSRPPTPAGRGARASCTTCTCSCRCSSANGSTPSTGIVAEEEPRWAQGVTPPELWDLLVGLPPPTSTGPQRLDPILRRIEQW